MKGFSERRSHRDNQERRSETPSRYDYKLVEWQPAEPEKLSYYAPIDNHVDGPHAIEAHLPEVVARLEQRIGEPCPENVPLTLMQDYYARLGLDTPPAVFFHKSEQNLTAVQEIVSEAAATILANERIMAVYDPAAHVAMVDIQESEDESLLAKVVAHEFAHGSEKHLIEYAHDSNGDVHYTVSLRGPHIFSSGGLISEGRAELLAAHFREIAFGKSSADMYSDASQTYMSEKYLHREANGQFTEVKPARSAVALELLIALSPGILDDLISGAPEKVIARKVNAIQRKLWQPISQAGEGEQSRLIIQHLIEYHFNNDNSAPLWASDICNQLIRRKLGLTDS